MKRLRAQLTYANVISTLCLFLLLGGGAAFAAAKLGKNSVGTKQIKNNAITGPKIKDGAVTGSKINLSSIGTVPTATNSAHATNADTALTATHATTADSAADAAHAGTADSANVASNATALGGTPSSGYAKTELEPVHVVGAAGQPPFGSGCQSFPFALPVGFYKDQFGVVHLRGYVISCSSNPTVFQLPAGFRPQGTELFPAMKSNTESDLVEIGEEGAVNLFGGVNATLSGIEFRTR